jgi:stage V sporulation protein R
LEIIRQESFYFYPQYCTKILNEGIASVIHAEFMSRLDSITPEEHLDFCRVHERVVQPGGNPLNINPYFLGFTILQDIRRRWDNYKSAGESSISGIEKMIEVVSEEDDISLIKNYLTKELVEEMNLFAYKSEKDKNGDTILTIKSRNPDDVAEHLTKDMHNYRSPVITIEKASPSGLELVHSPTNGRTLDERNLSKVMGYIYELWGSPVDVQTIDDDGKVVHHTYDEDGFSGEE